MVKTLILFLIVTTLFFLLINEILNNKRVKYNSYTKGW